MIGGLAKKVFEMQAKSLVKGLSENSQLIQAFEKYKKDSEAFQTRLKKLGVTSSEDLVKAVNDNPNIKTKLSTAEERDKNAKKLSNQLMSLGIF